MILSTCRLDMSRTSLGFFKKKNKAFVVSPSTIANVVRSILFLLSCTIVKVPPYRNVSSTWISGLQN